MKITRFAIPALAFALGTSGIAVAQQYGPPQGPPPQYERGPSGWDAAPEELRDVERQGFQDGIEGARHDVDNHRRPDVNNRDEYRHPHVPRYARDEYREGFQRGYQVAMEQMFNADRDRYGDREHHRDRDDDHDGDWR
ncbi:MAG: hypothetical protein M3Y50_07190 [Acidobacteriota bacterium]|nr:hypothetical protein [Acidobacteriota bacterium]